MSGRYAIKCDTCKREIGRTDSMGESAAGGTCAECSAEEGKELARIARKGGDSAEGNVETVGPWDGLLTCVVCLQKYNERSVSGAPWRPASPPATCSAACMSLMEPSPAGGWRRKETVACKHRDSRWNGRYFACTACGAQADQPMPPFPQEPAFGSEEAVKAVTLPVDLVVIHWRSRRTGHEGHGSPIPRSSAEAWLEVLKAEHPAFDHWLVFQPTPRAEEPDA